MRRGQGVISGQGEFSSPPYPFARPLALFLSPATGAAGGLRRISLSGASLSISFGGDDPHLVLLPWMPVLPPLPRSSCPDFQSSILGAVTVASLDFWPNLGLSRMEKGSRQFGLMLGWSIFEFGRTVVPDLTTVVGNCCFPVSSGTTALSRAVLPLGAVLPLAGRGTTALYQFPQCSVLSVIFLLMFCGLCSFFLVVLRVLVFGSR